MKGLAPMWLSCWANGCCDEVCSCCWKEIGCSVVNPPPTLLMTGTVWGCVEVKPGRQTTSFCDFSVYSHITGGNGEPAYRWGARTPPGSWRRAARPWWGSVRRRGRRTGCAARSECLLGAVGRRWTPESIRQHDQDGVQVVCHTHWGRIATRPLTCLGFWVSRSVWLGSSWIGLTTRRPTLSPPPPLTELTASHRIWWLYFTPGNNNKELKWTPEWALVTLPACKETKHTVFYSKTERSSCRTSAELTRRSK